MLGELFYESTGQVTVSRLLSVEGGLPKFETSFENKGKLAGIETTETCTYSAEIRPDGTLQGGGHGVIITQDGQMLTFIGSGVGRFTGQGQAASFRGVIYFHTSSEKLSRFNALAGVYEYEMDETGKGVNYRVWEWK